jgi:hypothetical protein
MNNLNGGGVCSLCKTPGVNATTCPLNPKAKNAKPNKHYLIKHTKKTIKHIPIEHKKTKKTIKINCKKFKKTKPPKCDEQFNCEWIPKRGNKVGYCDDTSNVEKFKKLKSSSSKKTLSSSEKTKKPIIKDALYTFLSDIKLEKYYDIMIELGLTNDSIIDKKFVENLLMDFDDDGNCDDFVEEGIIKSDIVKIKSKIKELKSKYDELFKLKELLDKIHSISGICDYGYIELKKGPILLNFGDYHTWTNRDEDEKDENKWNQLCDKNNNKEKQKIHYFGNNLFTCVTHDCRHPNLLRLNIGNILKNNEIFISHFILYLLKNFKNVHLFLELWKCKSDAIYTGRHATPMFFNKALTDFSRKRPQFMKDNNNFIHYNDFRSKNYLFYNIFKQLQNGKYKINGEHPLKDAKEDWIDVNIYRWINIIKNIYILSFLQGYNMRFEVPGMKIISIYLKQYDNKNILDIIRDDIGVYKPDMDRLIKESMDMANVVRSESKTIKIDGKTIHCTTLSKQLLKLKPDIQDKVVKWFYDLIISNFESIVTLDNVSGELKISYIFWILYIDFYNLCRILYYTGYGNTGIDMSNNIILNYGGENMYLDKPSKYSFFNVLDNNTGGHASSILLFYRKYLYGNGKGNNYVEKPTNNSINQKRHYSFKNDDIEIKKYLSRYIENRQNGRDCVEIK